MITQTAAGVANVPVSSRIDWSPYMAGIGIGVLSWIVFVVVATPIGITTAGSQVAGGVASLFVGQEAVQANPAWGQDAGFAQKTGHWRPAQKAVMGELFAAWKQRPQAAVAPWLGRRCRMRNPGFRCTRVSLRSARATELRGFRRFRGRCGGARASR